MLDLPLGNVVTAIATVISVVVANRLSFSQSGKAKLWDLRRQAFGAILSELASVERLCDVADSYIRENAYGYFHSETRTEHDTRIVEHIKTARQRFSDDYLIVSDAFIGLFEAFTTELEAGPPDDIFPLDHEHFAALVRKHRPLLLAQGRSEMAFRRRLRDWLPGFRHTRIPLFRAARLMWKRSRSGSNPLARPKPMTKLRVHGSSNARALLPRRTPRT